MKDHGKRFAFFNINKNMGNTFLYSKEVAIKS